MDEFIGPRTSISEDLITKLIVLDKLPLKTLTGSESIRFLFERGSLELPQSPATVRKILKNKADKLRSEWKKEFASLIKQRKKFSLSFDEYRGVNNRKYINLNLHSNAKEFWCLGLINIDGPGTAENIIRIVKNKLQL